jgi:hypothetical protein
MYPVRVYRTRTNLDTQKSVDKFLRKIVEWRKTFSPKPQDEATDFFSDPVLLDEFYCRDLLKGVPAIVECTIKLSRLTLSGISDSEFVYLREAATCYIFGLPEAAVALARAAVEDSLRRKLAKFFGKDAVAREHLDYLLDDLAPRGKTLSHEGRNLAHKVRVAANNVLHHQTIGQQDALDVIEAARTVILELSRP